VTGIVASIAANVARIYVPPADAPPGWSPPTGAIVAAAFWPIALLISIEIISRVQWPQGKGWWLIRYGGLSTVAAIAAIISYRHMSGLLAAYGEKGIGAAIGPLAVDGLMVVSSGALLAIADNVRRAARAEPAPVEVPTPAPPLVVEVLAEAPQRPSVLVPEGGAAIAPDVDTTALLEALSELEADGGVSGAKLSAALARRGLDVTERDARRVLAVLRPSKAGTDGDGPTPEPAPDEEPATAAEPMPVMEPVAT
jgi:hypothetical protein